MTVGILHLHLMIPGAQSLKDRRRALRSLKDQIRNRYNCSLAEVGEKEKWSRATLAAAVVSDDSGHVSAQLNEIVRFIDSRSMIDLIHYEIETW